jgi:hypothetical protein
MEPEWIAFLVHPRINDLRAGVSCLGKFLSSGSGCIHRFHFPPAVFVNSPYDNQGYS